MVQFPPTDEEDRGAMLREELGGNNRGPNASGTLGGREELDAAVLPRGGTDDAPIEYRSVVLCAARHDEGHPTVAWRPGTQHHSLRLSWYQNAKRQATRTPEAARSSGPRMRLQLYVERVPGTHSSCLLNFDHLFTAVARME